MLESLIKSKTVKTLVSIVSPLILASGVYFSDAHASMDEEGKAMRSTSNCAYDYTPAWSPDSKKIAFTRNDDIYIVNTDGAGLKRLTSNPADDYNPSWSPDGTKIAFQSRRDGNWEIYVVNTDGTGLKRLTNHSGDDGSPSWSPDGTKMAFNSNREKYPISDMGYKTELTNYDIYTMNADGSDVKRITNHVGIDTSPSWSPDGKKIAFESYRDKSSEIYVINVGGGNEERLTNNFAIDESPSWSSNGIAFHSSRDGNLEIYTMNADGSDVKRITNHPASDHSPVWSPDGKKLAFMSNRDGVPFIYIKDIEK